MKKGEQVVSSRERGPRRIQSVVIDNIRVLYQPREQFPRLAAQFAHQGFQIQETPHFLWLARKQGQQSTLVHCITLQEIDNNAGHLIMQELASNGLIPSEQEFGAFLIGIVSSLYPSDPAVAWGRFSQNTLQRLREKLSCNPSTIEPPNFISSFAGIYRNLFSHLIGSSLLDVGCACAFWPVLVAEQYQHMQNIVGADNRQEAINLSNQLASYTRSQNILRFVLADVLQAEFPKVGMFDTVTAIHLLEHIPDDQIFDALRNLLQVTNYRLLIAVPYEDQPEQAFGHQHSCSRETLETWGAWCVKQLDGQGSFHCQDVHGGLLIVDRN